VAAAEGQSLVNGAVGPLSLGEHLGWFVVLSLAVFLVYNGLRVESVREAVVRGVQRWFAFVLGSTALALVFHLLSSFL
jgi:hypothetical protein